jgi:hypothetical protein
LEKLYAQLQEVHDSLEEKLGAIKCESGNVEVQWNNIKKCVSDTMSDLNGKVKRRARKPWITQDMISKINERRKWKKVKNEEGRKNYRRQGNEFKRAKDNAKKEYLESICNEIIEFQRTGRYDLMYMKTKELGWKQKPWESKYWHLRLSREYNNRSETSIANLVEVYHRALQSS